MQAVRYAIKDALASQFGAKRRDRALVRKEGRLSARVNGQYAAGGSHGTRGAGEDRGMPSHTAVRNAPMGSGTLYMLSVYAHLCRYRLYTSHTHRTELDHRARAVRKGELWDSGVTRSRQTSKL